MTAAPPDLRPVLVGCGHGTRDAAGRRAVARLRLDVAALRPGLEVVAASVDVQKPALPDVVARLAAAGRRCVVVPLLLSAGYHVHTDVAQAVAASGGLAVAAGALGRDDALVEVLADRLREKGFHAGADAAGPGEALVLAAAGSSDPRALADVEQVGSLLAQRVGAPVTAAYLSAAQPRVADAVDALRSVGRRVTVASYLLSPGFFAERLARLGDPDVRPDVRVTAPLAPHPLLAGLALRRYDAAVAAAGWAQVS
ncbi:sirohydrochlorin chelatase [Kineosporia sp. A_224]|uniref:sirohydrochlorin chelatase n=1 Tax=Kineosporia sp. A_224 TaxID=1962180 RepID=UPI0018E9AF48|nr:CbiX/SirB N-terminal domain-containing protein [Kineosporia sp. A_224]